MGLPSILVISLKRFSYNRYWRDKLDTHVESPVTGLDMGPYISNKNHAKAVYDLMAVSNHYGGMGGGHYTAYAKNKDDGRWDQSRYVLFYQRREDCATSCRSPPSAALGAPPAINGTIRMNGDASSEEDMEIS